MFVVLLLIVGVIVFCMVCDLWWFMVVLVFVLIWMIMVGFVFVIFVW